MVVRRAQFSKRRKGFDEDAWLDSGRLRTPLTPLEEGDAEVLRPILAKIYPSFNQAA